jgi:hypothetical protein
MIPKPPYFLGLVARVQATKVGFLSLASPNTMLSILINLFYDSWGQFDCTHVKSREG